ncbi:hypothetical protein C0993_000416 [Termitomyces sp. T159_Od127]|nr:hypothetical protein C0993_000416 [Termitomyces sp. T159_Od127]
MTGGCLLVRISSLDIEFILYPTELHLRRPGKERYRLDRLLERKAKEGKDYSNPRVTDFHTLNKPEEDMYDRSKVPRMPWHDVAMQVVGQPARDLARHFVQRWNYLLRIKPEEYISVFSLRNWAKMRGDVLTTEQVHLMSSVKYSFQSSSQVYIHGKVCIVDDRLAIIGSANINERSQRGDRDSELAAVIRDTDMIDCTMAGKPFKVGRFAHTLRVRLMREHLGVNVDALDEEDLMSNNPVQPEYAENAWDPDTEQVYGREEGVTHIKKSKRRTAAGALFRDTLGGANQAVHATGENASKATTNMLQKLGTGEKVASSTAGDDILKAERKTFTREGQEVPGFASSMVPTLEEKTVGEGRPPTEQRQKSSKQEIDTGEGMAGCDVSAQRPHKLVTEDRDSPPRTGDRTLYGAPADASWSPQTDDQPPHTQSGVNDANKEEQVAVEARASIRVSMKAWKMKTPRPKVEVDGFEDPISDAFWKNVWVASAVHNPRDSASSEPVGRVPSETGDEGAPTETGSDEGIHQSREGLEHRSVSTSNSLAGHSEKDFRPRRPTRGSEPFEKWEREEMEKLLVLFPNRFLEGEDIANNFLFNADRYDHCCTFDTSAEMCA